ncbi:MAG: hypothetical protein MUP16_03695 [Sedimentisphaerales bacterium]|nr:hypothetical protein [Sedimentisphaerales bacterium]
MDKKELDDLAQKGVDSFILEEEAETNSKDTNAQQEECFCPYCGQLAPDNSWWTKEQLAYMNVFAKNIMVKMFNEHFIRPLRRNSSRLSSGLISMRFEGKEMKEQEPWISPETDDMDVFELPCCQRKMKIEDDWKGKVYCFFCGFPFLQKS